MGSPRLMVFILLLMTIKDINGVTYMIKGDKNDNGKWDHEVDKIADFEEWHINMKKEDKDKMVKLTISIDGPASVTAPIARIATNTKTTTTAATTKAANTSAISFTTVKHTTTRSTSTTRNEIAERYYSSSEYDLSEDLGEYDPFGYKRYEEKGCLKLYERAKSYNESIHDCIADSASLIVNPHFTISDLQELIRNSTEYPKVTTKGFYFVGHTWNPKHMTQREHTRLEESYAFWAPGQPDDNMPYECLAYQNNTGLHNVPCHWKQSFICEKMFC